MSEEIITPSLRFLGIAVALGFSLIVVELVRRRALLEKYAFAWILVSLGLLVLALVPVELLRLPVDVLGISVPVNMLFLVGFISTGAFLLRITVHISQLNEKITRLTQEVSILGLEIEKIQQSSSGQQTKDG